MTKRLLYTKDILTQMLNTKLQQSHTSNPKHIDKIKSERVNHTLLKSSGIFISTLYIIIYLIIFLTLSYI